MRVDRQALSLRQILAYFPLWNDDDRHLVKEALAKTAELAYVYTTPGSDYMTGRDLHDRLVLYIGAGYVQWETPGREANWLTLSRHVRTEPGPRHHQKQMGTCPRCKIYEVSVSGECPKCDG